MRHLVAEIFRLLFKVPFFKKKYFGIYKRILYPLNLFKGVKKRYLFKKTIRFDLYIDDWIQQNLFFLNEYEPRELYFVKNTIKEGDVFVDIGANIGLYTLYASKLVGEKGKVIAFEPFADNFNHLRQNVSLNYHKNIVLENLAISQKKEKIPIAYHVKEANKGMVSSYLNEFSYKAFVDSISLDLYFHENPITRLDFIKIDIEGGEYPALLGMRETLNKYGPTILIEINKEILLTTPYTEKCIVQYLQELNYEKYAWDNDQVFSKEVTHNFVFKRKHRGLVN